MDWSELFGLMIVLFFLAFPFFKQNVEQRKRNRNPAAYDRAQEQRQSRLQEFMEEHHIDLSEDKRRRTPPKKPKVSPEIPVKTKKPIQTIPGSYQVADQKRRPYGRELVDQLNDPQKLIVFQTVLSAPKSLEPPSEYN